MTSKEALERIQSEYDAFYVKNKYGEGTHNEEFNLLEQTFEDDEMALRALRWIKYEYDCYYQEYRDNDPDSAFNYLKNKLK